jgi:hypothetical protein
MRNRVTFGIFAAVAVAVALSTPALAGKKKSDLVGYTCVRVAVNFIECTKDGETTYWCDDAGNCEAKPARVRHDNFRAPLHEGLLEATPGLGTNPPRGFGSPAGATTAPLKLR